MPRGTSQINLKGREDRRCVFRREAYENSALLGYYAESSGHSLSTFTDNLSAPSSRDQEEGGGTDRLSRNVGKKLRPFAA